MDKSKQKSKGASVSGGISNISPSGSLRTNDSPHYDVHRLLEQFWPYQTEKIVDMSQAEFRETKISQELPLARIKKIMKLDEGVKTQMISAEAPVLFAKACELFIEELTVRAWIHTEDNKRKTLQKNDIALAIAKHDQFDFLIDIVPREEIAKGSGSGVSHTSGANKRASDSPATGHMVSNMPMFVQVGNSSASGIASQPALQTIQLQGGHVIQAQALGGTPLQLVQGANGELQLVNVTSSGQSQTAQLIPSSSTVPRNQAQPQQRHQEASTGETSISPPFPQAFQQIVAPDGTVHHLPIQLSPAQLNYLKQHLSGGTGQQQVHIIHSSSTSGTGVNVPTPASRPQAQQPTAFFIQTSAPVGHAQQQADIQLHMIPSEQQASDTTTSSS